MPDVSRVTLKMDCPGGLDLTHPMDQMPKGSFPYMANIRVLQEGRLDGRPGYTRPFQLSDQPNSIRRLSDPSALVAPSGYTYVGGGGPNLYAGTEPGYLVRDTGYSGFPLSLIPFRPDQSPEAWMYVFDRNKSAKVRPSNEIRQVGVIPPTVAPLAEYGRPANVDISTGQSDTSWVATGDSTTPATVARAPGAQIAFIEYVSGPPGWCVIFTTSGPTAWMGNRMKVILSGGPETVLVRDVLPAIVSSGTITVAEIQYDSGNTGPCSLKLNVSPDGLARNSLIQISGEIVRVLEVVPSPSGIGYSIRCSTAGPHGAGEVVIGLVSWFVYTNQAHFAGETITSNYVGVTHAAAGVGALELTSNINASLADNRPIDPANDYLHISLYIAQPKAVTDIRLLLTLDPTPNFSFDDPGNSFIFTLTPSILKLHGASEQSWADVEIPIASGTRTGEDLTRTLANITGIAVQMTSTGGTDYGFDWWYLFGTYGPVIAPGSPVGMVYLSRFRDSSTGAHSVPGPATRYSLYPLRESVIITPPTSAQQGVDSIDLYRQGGAVTSPLYIGTVANLPATPRDFTDIMPDSTVLAINQPPDLDALQPWPIQIAPLEGVVSVTGTTIELISGDQFPPALLNNTAIIIEGTTYLTYGQPRSPFVLELTQDAGHFNSANYSIASPTLAGQPLPFAFGPLEGPFAPVVFALGDRLNGGLLYFSNFSDADGASDRNTLELCAPSNSLVSGAVWNGLAFAGNRDSLFLIRYSYLTAVAEGGSNAYQWATIPSPSGIWSRWACCACPLGVAFLGRDGIYIATENGAVNISDERLYPLFDHDGQPARVITYGPPSQQNVLYPVDMSRLAYLRLTYCDESLYFTYLDTVGNANSLEYDIPRKRWFLHNYAHGVGLHYQVESSAMYPTRPQILMLSLNANAIMLAGGNEDDGQPIHSVVLTPALDQDDERMQKLHVDFVVQVDGSGTMDVAAAFDNAQQFSPVVTIPCTANIENNYLNLASLADLSLHLNVGAKLAWTGGPDGPRAYYWETSGFIQPYLSKFFVTQFLNLSYPGYKTHRRMYPALISTYPVLFTVKTQDGRTYGPYTIPSTNGQYRQFPIMLDQNIKDLAMAYQLDGQGRTFALFAADFVIETKEWTGNEFLMLAVTRT